MRSFLFLALIIGSLSGCSNEAEHEQLQAAFTAFKQAIADGNNQVVLQSFDQESKDYFTSLAELARWDNEDNKMGFCQQSGHPLSSLLLLQAGELMYSLDEPATYGPMNVLFNAEMLGFSFFDETRLSHYRFGEVLSIDGDQAQVGVEVKMDEEVWAESTYVFNKEKQEWRLNYLSTLSLMEKYLSAQQRKSGLAARAFIQQLLIDGPPEDARLQHQQ